MSRARKAPRMPTPRPEGSVRTCIGCRGVFERAAIARLVRGPVGEVGLDRHLRAPGRGAHLCWSSSCIEMAVKRRALSRAFQGAPVVTQFPDAATLRAWMVEALEARIADALALGRRSGGTVSGAEVVEANLERGRVGLLVLAGDVADATEARLRAKCEAAQVEMVVHLTRDALGANQGKAPRAAVAVVSAPLAERLRADFERLDRVCVAT